MKRSEALQLYMVVNSLSRLEGASSKFLYALARNSNLLKNEVDAIDKARAPFEKERIVLCESMAEKDDDGKAIMEEGNYKIKNMDEFNKKLEEAKTEHSDLDELLSEEVDIKLFKVSIDEFPTKGLIYPQMAVLKVLVRDDEVEEEEAAPKPV